MSDTYVTNSDVPFMELYNIFDTIIKSYPPNEESLTDNSTKSFIEFLKIPVKDYQICMKPLPNTWNELEITQDLLKFPRHLVTDHDPIFNKCCLQ